MIKIECGKRIFEIPENNSESFNLLQTTKTSGKAYTKTNIQINPALSRKGSFCFRNGTLKLEYPYIDGNLNLNDINIPKEGLDVIAGLSDFSDTYEKYKVKKIVEEKVGILDYIQVKLLGLLYKLANN